MNRSYEIEYRNVHGPKLLKKFKNKMQYLMRYELFETIVNSTYIELLLLCESASHPSICYTKCFNIFQKLSVKMFLKIKD